jgi:hypothetical protein
VKLIVLVRGDQADMTCNECGAVIRTVPAERAVAVMLEMASRVICSARGCLHHPIPYTGAMRPLNGVYRNQGDVKARYCSSIMPGRSEKHFP